MYYKEELEAYIPKSLQEEKDKKVMLSYINQFPTTILTRENKFAHITASSMIFDETRTSVLMIYHNIYHSWSWTGGHADGENNLLETAIREAKEETGIHIVSPIDTALAAVDILPVWGHMKKGKYVSSHLHLNFSYLLEAKREQKIQIKEDENSQVDWILIKEIKQRVSEPDMLPVYEKLIALSKESYNAYNGI